MASSLSVVGGFFTRALLWLIPALALWYWGAEWVVKPATWLAERAMLGLFPGWVLGVEALPGGEIDLLTSLRMPAEQGMVGELSSTTRVLKFTHGIPFFVALMLACRSRGLWWKLPLGLAVMVPFQAWGVCFEWLVDVAIMAGVQTQAQTGFGAWHANFFGIGAQLGYLIFPTLVPLMLWIAFEQGFVRTVVVDGALHELSRRDPRLG
ncbi:MAG TPA: hypothetical protein PLR02_10700 [Rhodocyclaceae bacterium]|nr:hypothetical protein [Rhodocyclaceae bacterium]